MHEAAAFLDEFGKLPDQIERPPTFMEIAGYPHYENVCSNLLAFFLDPQEWHGFGTLVLDALTSAGNLSVVGEQGATNVSIDREVSTDSGNRIDLLIESDTSAFMIENKIYANVSNPFADYAAFLDRKVPEERAKYKILLTISPSLEGYDYGFRNVTYALLVQEIRSLLGHYIVEADTRYLTMFLDFLNTLEHLQKESRMDREFVKLLSERREEVEGFEAALRSFRNELRDKVRELDSLVEIEGYDEIVEQWIYRPNTWLSYTLVHDIYVSETLPIFVDTVIGPSGWEMQISVRRGGDRSELGELLRRLQITFEENRRFICSERFDYDANTERVAQALEHLVYSLANSEESEA